jgi:hypothetical protein
MFVLDAHQGFLTKTQDQANAYHVRKANIKIFTAQTNVCCATQDLILKMPAQ